MQTKASSDEFLKVSHRVAVNCNTVFFMFLFFFNWISGDDCIVSKSLLIVCTLFLSSELLDDSITAETSHGPVGCM